MREDFYQYIQIHERKEKRNVENIFWAFDLTLMVFLLLVHINLLFAVRKFLENLQLKNSKCLVGIAIVIANHTYTHPLTHIHTLLLKKSRKANFFENLCVENARKCMISLEIPKIQLTTNCMNLIQSCSLRTNIKREQITKPGIDRCIFFLIAAHDN